MPKIALTLVLLLVLPAAAVAKTFTLGDEKPAATIVIPDGWKAEAADGGVEAFAPDESLYLSAEVLAGKDLRTAGQETSRALAEQKIKIKPETKTQKALTIAGFPAVVSSWEATDDDGPTQVHFTLVKLGADMALVMLRWGPEAAEKDHAAEIEAIQKSIAPVK